MKLKPQRPYTTKRGVVYYFKCPYCHEYGARKQDQTMYRCISCKRDYIYSKDYKKPITLRK